MCLRTKHSFFLPPKMSKFIHEKDILWVNLIIFYLKKTAVGRSLW